MKLLRPIILFLMLVAGVVFYGMALVVLKILNCFDRYQERQRNEED
jgi:hypothetical protein